MDIGCAAGFGTVVISTAAGINDADGRNVSNGFVVMPPDRLAACSGLRSVGKIGSARLTGTKFEEAGESGGAKDIDASGAAAD
jgi:hypothetical protein